jgi:catechol 2,3-dioxygenase-like lactoylglutathione lyase family enzyme
MIGRLDLLALDAPDIDRLAAFYADLTGWKRHVEEPDWITLINGAGQKLSFQLAPDHVPPRWPSAEHPQQVHLDLLTSDVEAVAEQAVRLGATRLGGGETWQTLADPAGHPFDLCHRDDGGHELGIYAVTFDAPDAPGLARFYADVLGMELRYEGEMGALIGDDTWQVMFQQVEEYNPPRWPDPAHPQQGHLDIDVEDLDAAETKVLRRGASRLPGEGERFRVFADPAGHPFCLCLPVEPDRISA